MSSDQPEVRQNLMSLGKSSGGCGGNCSCGGHGRKSREYVVIEPEQAEKAEEKK